MIAQLHRNTITATIRLQLLIIIFNYEKVLNNEYLAFSYRFITIYLFPLLCFVSLTNKTKNGELKIIIRRLFMHQKPTLY